MPPKRRQSTSGKVGIRGLSLDSDDESDSPVTGPSSRRTDALSRSSSRGVKEKSRYNSNSQTVCHAAHATTVLMQAASKPHDDVSNQWVSAISDAAIEYEDDESAQEKQQAWFR